MSYCVSKFKTRTTLQNEIMAPNTAATATATSSAISMDERTSKRARNNSTNNMLSNPISSPCEPGASAFPNRKRANGPTSSCPPRSKKAAAAAAMTRPISDSSFDSNHEKITRPANATLQDTTKEVAATATGARKESLVQAKDNYYLAKKRAETSKKIVLDAQVILEHDQRVMERAKLSLANATAAFERSEEAFLKSESDYHQALGEEKDTKDTLDKLLIQNNSEHQSQPSPENVTKQELFQESGLLAEQQQQQQQQPPKRNSAAGSLPLFRTFPPSKLPPVEIAAAASAPAEDDDNTNDDDADKLLYTFEGHANWIDCVAYCGNGQLISGSYDQNVKLWKMTKDDDNATTLNANNKKEKVLLPHHPKPCKAVKTFEGHTDTVVAVSPMGETQIISGSGDRTMKLWDIESGKCIRTFKGHSDWVSSVATNSLSSSCRHRPPTNPVVDTHQFISGSWDKTIKLWDSITGQCLHTFEGHSRGVCSVAYMSEDKIISASTDRTIKAWCLSDGRELRTFESHTDCVYTVVRVDHERFLSGSADHKIKLWNLTTGTCIRTFEGHDMPVRSVAVIQPQSSRKSSDNDNDNDNDNPAAPQKFISGSSDDTVKLWDLQTGQCIRTYIGHSGSVYSVATIGTDRIISGSWDKTVKVWSV